MPEGPDHYASMTELYANEAEGINYTKEWYRHRWQYRTFKNYKAKNEIFVIAPHGGSIESGTTELALATAGFTNDFNNQPAASGTYDYFIFNGTNPKKQNGRLHVTASHYNEPAALELVRGSRVSLAYHGCTDTQPDESTGKGYKGCLIGGLDDELKLLLEQKLQEAEFNAFITQQDTLNGNLPKNIVNRNKRKKGAQFEMTTSFLKSFYGIRSRAGRRKSTNADFWRFVDTVRSALRQYYEELPLIS